MVVARHQFTVTAYHRMRDAGVFAADERVELLDGEIVHLSPVGPRHAAIVRRLNALLKYGYVSSRSGRS
ncbi:Uma2 family endonuclease [Candidatus Viridilinea mediisalina]|uniref:Putative restriction endonuclease domain-containing protein n=1 Tax=Candidatus Viridilinea mediisalina TaxID=2024553 RepID=A0A2A6RL01_9CHLR|nr:Uma2 family endonuclease [Candidatus Viridilinea mediisalina]PDW03722.1 hypothetical protein CJ255_07390 [Candidatus Viridilinea mediisalina]